MPAIKVIEVIGRVEDVLQDTGVRWPRVELQRWLNEAYLSIILLRPDANSQSGTFTCAAGTRQTIGATFTNSIRLLDVTRNLASGSNKKVVRYIKRSVLDDQLPGWHGEPQTTNIQHYAHDPRQPRDFFVYPPANTSAQLEVIYSAAPTPHALSESELDPDGANTEVIRIDDIYLSPLVDWVLYRAYSKDAENGANEQRASAAYQTFNSAVGQKSGSDSAASPETVSPVV